MDNDENSKMVGFDTIGKKVIEGWPAPGCGSLQLFVSWMAEDGNRGTWSNSPVTIPAGFKFEVRVLRKKELKMFDKPED